MREFSRALHHRHMGGGHRWRMAVGTRIICITVVAGCAVAAPPAPARADLPRVYIAADRAIADDAKTPARMVIAGRGSRRGRR